MIDFLLGLLRESPILFMVLVVNIIIVAYIVLRIALYVSHKKQPGKVFSRFIWKIKAGKEKGEAKTVEDVYEFIIQGLRKEGVLDKGDKSGFKSRKKVMEKLPDGDKKALLMEFFHMYEAKVYGGREIRNEGKVVVDVLDRYADM